VAQWSSARQGWFRPRRDGNRLRLSGRVFWASNLFVSGFVMITAVAGPDGARPLIVALPALRPG
jgi:hypothetical protein